jgi:hypothetical protein
MNDVRRIKEKWFYGATLSDADIEQLFSKLGTKEARSIKLEKLLLSTLEVSFRLGQEIAEKMIQSEKEKSFLIFLDEVAKGLKDIQPMDIHERVKGLNLGGDAFGKTLMEISKE